LCIYGLQQTANTFDSKHILSHSIVLQFQRAKTKHKSDLLYAFFWVIPRRLNFICRRFRTLCSIFIGRWVRVESTSTYLPMKMEQSIPKRRRIKFRRRGITIFIGRKVRVESTSTYLTMKMEQTEHSETSSCKIQTPGNYRLHRQVGASRIYKHLPAYEDGTDRAFRNVVV